MRNRRLLRVRAPAKINRSLRVLRTAPDGYHEIRTIYQSLELHDTLTFAEGAGPFRLECDDRACPTDAGNLVWRAAEAIARAAGGIGPPRDIVIRIEKRIPMQAGLGGGSSDAAAALRGFAALWRVTIPREKTHAIAASLGADVPYFLEGGTMLGLERGDLLYPLSDPPAEWVVVVVPSFGVSTKDAYGWWDAEPSSTPGPSMLRPVPSRPAPARRRAPAESPLPDEGNDLQATVARHHPEIDQMADLLMRHGANHAAMSGSGSSVFGLFESRQRAVRAAHAAAGRFRRVVVTRTVNRVNYQALARP